MRWLFGFAGLGSVAVWAIVYFGGTYETPFAAFRYGRFQFVSAATCTEFQTAVDSTNMALGRWPAAVELTLRLGMVVGAAAGSTVSGIELIQAAPLIKGVRFWIADVFYPESAVRRLTIGGRRLGEVEASREFEEASIVAYLWFAFFAAGMFVLLALLPAGEFTLVNVAFEVASAPGNVGLSSGFTGPGMPAVAKTMFLFNMWIGRLEIIPVLVLPAIFVRGGVYR